MPSPGWHKTFVALKLVAGRYCPMPAREEAVHNRQRRPDADFSSPIEFHPTSQGSLRHNGGPSTHDPFRQAFGRPIPLRTTSHERVRPPVAARGTSRALRTGGTGSSLSTEYAYAKTVS